MRIYHLNTSKNAMKNKFYARKKMYGPDERVCGDWWRQVYPHQTLKALTVAKEHIIIARILNEVTRVHDVAAV